MGFRSYVRHFRGAILGLLRPSEAPTPTPTPPSPPPPPATTTTASAL